MTKLFSNEELFLKGDYRGLTIEELYKDYAFIEDPRNGEGEACCSEAKVEAITKWSTTMGAIIERSYERPIEWFLIVFKPYDKPYAKDPAFYAVKGIDKCRKLFKRPQAYILTRETQAQKVHVNAIVATDQDLLKYHDQSYCSKYKTHVQLLNSLADRQRALAYITKEGTSRTFTKYLDYLIYSRK